MRSGPGAACGGGPGESLGGGGFISRVMEGRARSDRVIVGHAFEEMAACADDLAEYGRLREVGMASSRRRGSIARPCRSDGGDRANVL